MRVLALADKRPPVDPAAMARQMRVEAVFCLGASDEEGRIILLEPRTEVPLGARIH